MPSLAAPTESSDVANEVRGNLEIEGPRQNKDAVYHLRERYALVGR